MITVCQVKRDDGQDERLYILTAERRVMDRRTAFPTVTTSWDKRLPGRVNDYERGIH